MTWDVRPRLLEWLALPLWPPACCFAASIALGTAFGMPAEGDAAAWSIFWRRALLLGAVVSIVVLAREVRGLLRFGYWRLDDDGIHRGRLARSRLVLPWRDVESVVLGMPDPLPTLMRLASHVPTPSLQASVDATRAWRQGAIVLRLRGRRLFAINLGGKQHRGGVAFMEALARRCADRIVPATTYTDAERRALARYKFRRVIDVPAG